MTSFRSAATSSPGASCRRWSSPTSSCASCLVPSATPTRPPRSPSARSWRGCPSTRISPARPATEAGRCPRSCFPGTMRKCVGSAWRRVVCAARSSSRTPSSYHSASRAVPALGSGGFFSPMSSVIDKIERDQLRQGLPSFGPGDRVRVHFQVIEGTRKRTQVFEGVVLRRQGSGVRETFTVRKQSFGVGVERTFPLHSPKIEKLEVAARGDVRRAKLYYLRGRIGKAARAAARRGGIDDDVVSAPAAAAPAATDAEGVAQDEVVPTETEAAPADEAP